MALLVKSGGPGRKPDPGKKPGPSGQAFGQPPKPPPASMTPDDIFKTGGLFKDMRQIQRLSHSDMSGYDNRTRLRQIVGELDVIKAAGSSNVADQMPSTGIANDKKTLYKGKVANLKRVVFNLDDEFRQQMEKSDTVIMLGGLVDFCKVMEERDGIYQASLTAKQEQVDSERRRREDAVDDRNEALSERNQAIGERDEAIREKEHWENIVTSDSQRVPQHARESIEELEVRIQKMQQDLDASKFAENKAQEEGRAKANAAHDKEKARWEREKASAITEAQKAAKIELQRAVKNAKIEAKKERDSAVSNALVQAAAEHKNALESLGVDKDKATEAMNVQKDDALAAAQKERDANIRGLQNVRADFRRIMAEIEPAEAHIYRPTMVVNRIRGLNTELKEGKEELARCRKEVLRQKANIIYHDKTVEAKQKAIDRLASEAETTRADLDRERSEVKIQSLKIEELEDKLDQERQTAEKKRADQQTTMEADAIRHAAEVAQMQQQLKEDADQHQLDAAGHVNELAQLQKQMRINIDWQQADAAGHATVIKQLQEQLITNKIQHQAHAARHVEEVAQLQEQLTINENQHQADAARHATEMTKLQNKLKTNKDECRTLRADVINHADEMKQKDERLAACEEEQQTLQAEAARRAKELGQMEQQLEAKAKQNEALQTQDGRRVEEMAQVKQELIVSKDGHQALQVEFARRVEEMAKVKQELEATANQNQVLQADDRHRVEEMARLKQDLEAKAKQNHALQVETARCAKKKGLMKQELIVSKDEHQALQVETARRAIEHKALQMNRARLATEMEQQLTLNKDQHQALQASHKANEMQSELHQQQITSAEAFFKKQNMIYSAQIQSWQVTWSSFIVASLHAAADNRVATTKRRAIIRASMEREWHANQQLDEKEDRVIKLMEKLRIAESQILHLHKTGESQLEEIQSLRGDLTTASARILHLGKANEKQAAELPIVRSQISHCNDTNQRLSKSIESLEKRVAECSLLYLGGLNPQDFFANIRSYNKSLGEFGSIVSCEEDGKEVDVCLCVPDVEPREYLLAVFYRAGNAHEMWFGSLQDCSKFSSNWQRWICLGPRGGQGTHMLKIMSKETEIRLWLARFLFNDTSFSEELS